jgi:hypothetical protein
VMPTATGIANAFNSFSTKSPIGARGLQISQLSIAPASRL